MAYKALYRKWRPTTFEEVVGQDQVIDVIKNQIKSESVGHAYLFSGTRGTGKTSTAKILSRALNCLEPEGVNPCNKCEICRGILEESIMDVVEIDAASNNGVDDIRDLRENVKYPPSKAKFKVYIIDEVHMLSQGAFNALLKTLEEPPNYVKFILATTEPHKLPETILSRCQRFDFKRVNNLSLMERLVYICGGQGIEFEEAALDMIIEKSDGAVRDSLSLLDQCISSSEEKLTAALVEDSLGLVSGNILSEIAISIGNKDTVSILNILNKVIDGGKNISQFINDLSEFFRKIMLYKVSGDSCDLINVSDSSFKRIEENAEIFKVSEIMKVLNVLVELENSLKWSTNSRILLEMAMVNITLVASNDTSGLEERIKKLEDIIKSGKLQMAGSGEKKSGPKKIAPIISKDGDGPKAPVFDVSKEPEKVSASDYNIDTIQENWGTILGNTKKNKVTLYAFLVEGHPISIVGNILNIGFKDNFGFHVSALSKPENKTEIERIIYNVIGYKVSANCDFASTLSDDETSVSSSDDEKDKLMKFFGEHEDKIVIEE